MSMSEEGGERSVSIPPPPVAPMVLRTAESPEPLSQWQSADLEQMHEQARAISWKSATIVVSSFLVVLLILLLELSVIATPTVTTSYSAIQLIVLWVTKWVVFISAVRFLLLGLSLWMRSGKTRERINECIAESTHAK